MTLDEPGIRHQRRSLCRCLRETWTAPTPRSQRGQPHVDGPLGGPSQYHGLWPWLIILARAHPDDQVVPGIDHHAADRVRPVAVKDRRPRGARVCRLPDTPGSGRDVPGAVLHRIHGNVADPARHQGRPYPLIGSHPRRRPPCLHHQLPMTRRWPPAPYPVHRPRLHCQ